MFVDQGRPHEALELLERAVSICDKKTCEPETHGRALLGLARALVARNGDREHAVRLVRQARELLGKTPYLRKELEEANAWLKQRGVE